MHPAGNSGFGTTSPKRPAPSHPTGFGCRMVQIWSAIQNLLRERDEARQLRESERDREKRHRERERERDRERETERQRERDGDGDGDGERERERRNALGPPYLQLLAV